MSKYINCICGSNIQIRNINNHFKAAKHQKFLLNNHDLQKSYKNLLLPDKKISHIIIEKKDRIINGVFTITF